MFQRTRMFRIIRVIRSLRSFWVIRFLRSIRALWSIRALRFIRSIRSIRPLRLLLIYNPQNHEIDRDSGAHGHDGGLPLADACPEEKGEECLLADIIDNM